MDYLLEGKAINNVCAILNSHGKKKKSENKEKQFLNNLQRKLKL